MFVSSSSLEMSTFPFLSSLEREPKSSDYRQWVDEEVLSQVSSYPSSLILHYVREVLVRGEVHKPLPGQVCHTPFCGEKDFIYMYEPMLCLLGVTFPFHHFEAEVLWALGLAPSQLHPNGWTVIQAFRLICRFFGVVPTVSLLLYFYQSDTPVLASWVRLIPKSGRDLFTEYEIPSSTFRPWFFKVSAAERRLFTTTARSFPLYWQNVPSVDKVPVLSQEDQT
ncbi:hypothetical protein CR513_60346, partial [Mucuna pruriens]